MSLPGPMHLISTLRMNADDLTHTLDDKRGVCRQVCRVMSSTSLSTFGTGTCTTAALKDSARPKVWRLKYLQPFLKRHISFSPSGNMNVNAHGPCRSPTWSTVHHLPVLANQVTVSRNGKRNIAKCSCRPSAVLTLHTLLWPAAARRVQDARIFPCAMEP